MASSITSRTILQSHPVYTHISLLQAQDNERDIEETERNSEENSEESQLEISGLDSENFQERWQTLLHIARLLPVVKSNQRLKLFAELRRRLFAEEEKEAKATVIMLLARLTRDPGVDVRAILEDFMSQLYSNSTTLRCQLYSAILSILKVKRIGPNASTDMMNTLQSLSLQVLSELSDPHHRIRSCCIGLLGSLSLIINQRRKFGAFVPATGLMQSEIQAVISSYGMDPDPRVRKTALQTLLQSHVRGFPLNVSLYELGVIALKDDYEEVRIEALNLIWSLSSLYPDHMMKLAHDNINEQVKLLDDAFVKICDMVNDGSVNVRARACTIMASFRNVDANVLDQTFSKQIISHLKRRVPKGTGHGQQTKWQTVVPVAEGDFDVESDEFRLLDSGACGALVHGLEDEYQEVRDAAIDSICELCLGNDRFTAKATDFLVDMFNDDIDYIRLNAINSLRKIGARSTLKFNAEQLEISMGALEDADRKARLGTHGLLRVVRLADDQSLDTLITSLLENMRKHPEDRLSIYQCLRDVGKRHCDYLESFVLKLLKLDTRFLAKEENFDDPIYIAHMILIFNACTSNLSILRMLPKYTFRHFPYLYNRFPDCFGNVEDLQKHIATLTKDHSQSDHDNEDNYAAFGESVDVDQFMEQALEMVKSLQGLLMKKDYDAAIRVVDVTSRDLNYIVNVKPLLSGKTHFASLYLECCKILIKIKQEHRKPSFVLTAQHYASRLLQISYEMEHAFLGLGSRTRHCVMYFRVLAHAIWMFSMLSQVAGFEHKKLYAQNMLRALIKRITGIQRHFENDDLRLEELGDLRVNLLKAFNSPTTSNFQSLYSFINEFIPLDIDLGNPLKRTTAVVISPSSNIDKPIEFNSQYPFAIDIEAELLNVLDVGNIAIEILLPDNSIRIFRPFRGHFRPTTPHCYKLTTQIELDQNAWSGPSFIEIRLAKLFEPDLPSLHDNYILHYPNAAGHLHGTTVCVSTSVKYYVSPREIVQKI